MKTQDLNVDRWYKQALEALLSRKLARQGA